jgi:hypothetical protein
VHLPPLERLSQVPAGGGRVRPLAGDVIAAARASLGGDPDGYRAEFLRLAAAAQSLGLARTEEPR